MIRVIGLPWNKLGTMSLHREIIFTAVPIQSTGAEVMHLLFPEVTICSPGIELPHGKRSCDEDKSGGIRPTILPILTSTATLCVTWLL
jgi:hypothetical protein